jgi:hypothetical protein
MFGEMTLDPLIQLQSECSDDRCDLVRAVSVLLAKTDHPEIARWVQFPAAVLLFLVIPGDPEGGAFYVFDRKHRTWFWVDFEDLKYGGYAIAVFEELAKRPPHKRRGNLSSLRIRRKGFLLQRSDFCLLTFSFRLLTSFLNVTHSKLSPAAWNETPPSP